jgi:TrmH family RNA methyltransferase
MKMHVSVVLVGIQGGINLGLIARAALNFGIEELRLVGPRMGEEEWERARIHSSHGWEKLEKAKIYGGLEEALKDVDLAIATSAKRRMEGPNILRRAIGIQDLERILGEREIPRIALVFGREDSGLTNREIDRCHLLLSLEASEGYRTLNLASAAAILFHALYNYRQRGEESKVFDREKCERAIAHFRELAGLTIMSEGKAKKAVKAFSNILNRAVPDEREASLILGVLRKAALLIGRHK